MGGVAVTSVAEPIPAQDVVIMLTLTGSTHLDMKGNKNINMKEPTA